MTPTTSTAVPPHRGLPDLGSLAGRGVLSGRGPLAGCGAALRTLARVRLLLVDGDVVAYAQPLQH